MYAAANRRSLVLIGAAMALPILLLVVIQIVFAFTRESEELEQRTLADAKLVVELVDSRIDADFGLMEVLASAEMMDRRAWPSAYARAREIAALNPHWRNVIVSDLTEGREVFSTALPFNAGARPISPAIAASVGTNVGGVVREGEACPCVYLHLPIGADQRYLLSVALDPAVFQTILLAHAPQSTISAVVDRDGLFIARSAEFQRRVGTPSTRFVRDAIAGGAREGAYEGVTWEGFRNHTAFAVSPTSGWSTHIAIDATLIDAPRTYSFVSVLVGALLALALAAGLILWALRDIVERRQAEARMAQTQKLEAVGQLTGGVAHDFNNLLTVVIGGLNMLLKRITDEKQRAIAEQMLEAAKRGDRLTKQLLAFSRGKQMELSAVDLHQLVPGMKELLHRSIEAGTTLEFNLHPDARWVRSDANQLELAILNLVINARDAMPEGGRIEIAVRPSAKSAFVELCVSDNGIGMPKDVADRAMEPFFTTKPSGKGTGLGLAQVYGAVRQFGGSMEIDSAPARGTTVRLLLPRVDAPGEQQQSAPEAAAAPSASGAGQRVLVVDDEPGVRAFMAETLREAGFDAVEAEDPGTALRLLEARQPDLLLTDYSMPGMTGLELAEHARARANGELRVLIVSGYADAEALEASAARPALLRKPFDENALIAAVRDALAA